MKVVFRRSNKIGSRIIRLFTGEKWSHVGVQFENDVFHSDFRGSRVSSFEEFAHGSEYLQIEVVLTEAAQIRAVAGLYRPYDFPAFVMFGLLLPFMRIFKARPKITVNPRWFFCSEYSEYILWNENHLMTPEQILQRIQDEN